MSHPRSWIKKLLRYFSYFLWMENMFRKIRWHFYRAMLCRVRICYGKSSVCLSVCLWPWLPWSYSFYSIFENNYTQRSNDLLQGNQPEIPGGMWVGYITRGIARFSLRKHGFLVVCERVCCVQTFCVNLPSWSARDHVICLSEMKLGFMASGCLAPGFSTLLANLFVMRSYKRVCHQPSLSITTLVQTRKPSYRWQTRATRKPAKIAPIRRAYNVVADNIDLSSCV